jgi:hypothetical protein
LPTECNFVRKASIGFIYLPQIKAFFSQIKSDNMLQEGILNLGFLHLLASSGLPISYLIKDKKRSN